MEQPITADDISRDLIHFIAKSPSTFHAVRGIKAALTTSSAKKKTARIDKPTIKKTVLSGSLFYVRKISA